MTATATAEKKARKPRTKKVKPDAATEAETPTAAAPDKSKCVKKAKGWFITGLASKHDWGPYDTKKEAEEQRKQILAAITTPSGEAVESPLTDKQAEKLAKKAEAARKETAGEDGKPGRGMSMLDAAEAIFKTNGNKPLNCKDLIAAMVDAKLWVSTAGKTPHATLYSSFLGEIKRRGKDARFVKAERGLWHLK